MRKLKPKEAFLICGGQNTDSTLTLPTITVIGTQPDDPITFPEVTSPDGDGGGHSDPQESPFCAAPSRDVDYNFLSESEGGQLFQGYTPGNDRSGVTIATGIDLYGRTQQSIASLGWPQPLINQLLPDTTQQGQAASAYLSAHPLIISEENADLMDSSVFDNLISDVADRFNNAASFADFDQLPPGVQTAMIDVAYQYGSNLSRATPNFWQQITTGDWDGALANLLNFGDQYGTRRGREAALLQEDLSRYHLPPLITLVNGNHMNSFIFAATALLVGILSSIAHADSPPSRTVLQQDLRQYFGDERGNYLNPNWLISRQVYESMLHPAPKDSSNLPQILRSSSLDLYEGSRPQSCTEKSAVVYRKGHLVNAAIISNKCTKIDKKTVCSRKPTLTIFEAPSTLVDEDEATNMLKSWGQSKYKEIPIEIKILNNTGGRP